MSASDKASADNFINENRNTSSQLTQNTSPQVFLHGKLHHMIARVIKHIFSYTYKNLLNDWLNIQKKLVQVVNCTFILILIKMKGLHF